MLLRLVLLLFVSPWLWGDYNLSSVPGWVIAQPIPQASHKEEAYGVRYLLVDRQRRLSDDHEWQSFHHYVEQPLNQDGLVDVGKLEINFQPIYQNINLHYLRIWRDGRVIDKLPSARIDEISVEPDSDAEQISQTKQILIIIDGLKIGDNFEYAYTLEGLNPVFGDALTTSFQVGWAVPVDTVSIRLIAPKSKPLTINILNTSQLPVVSDFEGQTSYQWQQSPALPVLTDENMPLDLWIYPVVEYSEYVSWSEVAAWASGLFKLPDTPQTTQWQLWIEELKKISGKSRQAASAVQMVQNRIRYVGIEVGQNSHLPHHPDETLALGYGDCKDKALLLVSLLEALNIRAVPALVHSDMGQSLLNLSPSPKAFNHVIVKISLQGKTYWVDPTRTYQVGKELADLGYVSYGVALAAEQGAELETMPWLSGRRSKVLITETYRTYGYQVPVRLDVVSRYTGSEAEDKRRQILNVGLRQLSNDYLNYYDRAFGGAEILVPLHYVDDLNVNELEIIESYWLEKFWRWSEDKQLYEYRIEASMLGSYLSQPKQLRRRYPWGQKPPKYIMQQVDIFYPEYLSSAKLRPMEYVFEDEYVQFFARNQELGHVTRYQFGYLNYKDRVKAEDIRSHARLLGEASGYLSFSGWVHRHKRNQNENLYPWFQRIESQMAKEINK